MDGAFLARAWQWPDNGRACVHRAREFNAMGRRRLLSGQDSWAATAQMIPQSSLFACPTHWPAIARDRSMKLQIFRNWRQLTQGLSQGYPMKYHAISAALIVVAIFLELAGVGKAASDLGASLFTAGCACEFWFWIRLRLVRKSRRHETTST